MIKSKDFLSAILVGASMAIAVHLLPGGGLRPESATYMNHSEHASDLIAQRR